MHKFDLYKLLKLSGYNDQNLTVKEVSIPFVAIQELAENRAAKANVVGEKQIHQIFVSEGDQVYEPYEDGWGIAGDIVFGRRIYVDDSGNSWDVGPDGKIIEPTAYSGSPDFGVSGRVAKILRSINQLNQMQRRGQTPTGIKRFDSGKGTVNNPNDEVHFFGSESSLYRNGTWRHNKNKRQLTRDQIKFLEENGWTIPK